MLKIIKESFYHTNKYIILATPLILFSLLSGLYLLFSINGNVISQICALILFFLMTTAFLAGWFYMISLSLKNDDFENPNLLLKEFASGVGEYFLPMAGLLICVIITFILFGLFSYFVGLKLIGKIGISVTAFSNALASVESMKTFLTTLSSEQLIKLNAWNLLFLGTICLSYFIIMFYSPALFFKNKNPIKAIFISLKDLLSIKFFKNLFLFILIFGLYALISILSTIFSGNIVMHFIFTLINFYYMVYGSVCVYNYYYSIFVKTY